MTKRQWGVELAIDVQRVSSRARIAWARVATVEAATMAGALAAARQWVKKRAVAADHQGYHDGHYRVVPLGEVGEINVKVERHVSYSVTVER